MLVYLHYSSVVAETIASITCFRDQTLGAEIQTCSDAATTKLATPPLSLEDACQYVVGTSITPPCLPHSQDLMGAGLAGRPPCLPHSQVLMGAGLAGGPPCLPHSQVLMGAGLAGGPPYVQHMYSPTFIFQSHERIPSYG